MVLVMSVPALGAMVLTRMLYLAPSRARVRERPRIPSFYNLSTLNPKIKGKEICNTYSRCVVGLAKISVDTAGRGGVDNTAKLLFQEIGPGSLGDAVGTSEVDIHNRSPKLVIHVGEGFITQVTSVVDNNINAAEIVNSSLNDSWTILTGGLGSNGLAASLFDFLNYWLRVHKVVDNNGCTILSKHECIRSAKSKILVRIDVLALDNELSLTQLQLQ